MAKTEQPKTFRWQAHKPLLAATLAVAGSFSMVGAVLAEGTAADTPITNTATATYSDGTTPFSAVSNTVTILVAEVAGLTVTQSGFNDPNGGSIVTDDNVSFDFLVTNTGNAGTYVYVPGADQIDVSNGTTLKVEIVNPDTGAVLATVPGGGGTASNDTNNSTQALLGANGIIAPNTSFTVRVTVKVTANAVGQKIGVQFGNTLDNTAPPANGTQNQQNIPDTTDAGQSLKDVRTLNEGAKTPVNGEREAADFREEAYATSTTKLAQALILKRATYSNSTTPANPSDDKIAYGLELRVGNQTFPSVDPGKLEGTAIKVNGTSSNRILVSDAIPTGTVFDASVAPTAPTNWTVVYSTSALSANALDADWVTAQPAAATSIKRVGFIYNPVASGALAPLTTVTGFNFTVVTTGITAPSGTVANIAQVFGKTEGDNNNNLVYDESGDQQPNNFNDGFTPTNNTTTFDPASDFGIADPNDPEPTANANDGIGPDGESNVVIINTQPPAAGDIFNGPNGSPAATGPTNTNDDFTNVAATLDPTGGAVGVQDTTSNPLPVTVTNTVQNPSTTSRLDTVTLLPLAPSKALAATGTGIYGNDVDLPDGTLVTIAFGGKSTEYVYNITGTVGAFTATGNGNNGGNPVKIGTLNASDIKNYTVTIDLPPGTRQVRGYGVPVVAFVDNDGNGAFTPATETVANITIDRAYTGFMTLLKEARVIYAPRDGVTTPPSAFSADNTALSNLLLRPNDSIEYKVTYKNISEGAPAAGGGNAVLNARSFTVVEDGSAGGNTWGGVTLHQTGTTRSQGTVTYTTPGGPVTADPANNAAVSVYTNSVGTVVPQANGTLTFIRKVK